MPRRTLTQADIDVICERYVKGEGIAKLSEEYGVSYSGIYNVIRKTKIRADKRCFWCGKMFRSDDPNMRYCTRTCSKKAARAERKKECAGCGEMFSPKSHNQMFCDSCREDMKTRPEKPVTTYCVMCSDNLALRGECYCAHCITFKPSESAAAISKIVQRAREKGMTYGQYMASVR